MRIIEARIPGESIVTEIRECDRCRQLAYFRSYCGVFVCNGCEEHEGLARCYCGWSAGGGNGRHELLEMGEVIDPEGYY